MVPIPHVYERFSFHDELLELQLLEAEVSEVQVALPHLHLALVRAPGRLLIAEGVREVAEELVVGHLQRVIVLPLSWAAQSL